MEVMSLHIREAMQATGLTKKAVYYYENEGLIHPEKDRWNNYRNYSPDDVMDLILIGVLRRLGFSLSSVRKVLKNPSEMKSELLRQKSAIAGQMANLSEIDAVIDRFLKETEGKEMKKEELAKLHKDLGLDPRQPGFMLRELDRILPGNLGKTFAVFYGQFLSEPLDSEEKLKAWQELVDRLDSMDEIEYPDDVKEAIETLYGKISDGQLSELSLKSEKIVNSVLARTDPDPELVEEAKRKMEEYERNPDRERERSDFQILQNFLTPYMEQFEDLSDLMEILSPRFKTYRKLFMERLRSDRQK